jgi:hypothetical protein
MKAKLHTLQVEIKKIESLMDSLDSQMRRLAMEEVRNLRFEMDTLSRNAMSNTAMPRVVTEQSAVYA